MGRLLLREAECVRHKQFQDKQIGCVVINNSFFVQKSRAGTYIWLNFMLRPILCVQAGTVFNHSGAV